MKNKGNTSFASNALLLCIGGIICKIIGALYKIPLTNVLGAEGIGLYQTVFPTFAILLTLSSGGISQTVSALVSQDSLNGYGILKGAFKVVTIGSVLLGSFMLGFAPLLSTLCGNGQIYGGFIALVPALVLSGYSALLRGYFQAKSKFFPTVLSQIIEQAVKLVVGTLLSLYFLKDGVISAVIGALIGLSIAETLSLLYLSLRYLFSRDKAPKRITIPYGYDFIRVFKYALPLALGGIIMPISSLIDSVTVVNVLTPVLGQAQATALYGLQSGTVSTLANLPAVFTVALGIAVVPSMSREKLGGVDALTQKASISIKLTLFICIPISLFMAILAPKIIQTLYPALSSFEQTTASNLLLLSTFGITALGVTQIYSSLLFSLGLSTLSVRNLLIATSVKCLLLFPLLHFFGIYGAVCANVICFILSALLNAHSWRKILPTPRNQKSLAFITFASLICAIPLLLMKSSLNLVWLIALCLLCVVIYLYITLKTGVFSESEKSCLPIFRKFTKPKRGG